VVNVDHTILVGRNERPGDDLHVPGQYHQLDICLAQQGQLACLLRIFVARVDGRMVKWDLEARRLCLNERSLRRGDAILRRLRRQCGSLD